MRRYNMLFYEWQRNKIFYSVSEGGKVLISEGMKDKGIWKSDAWVGLQGGMGFQ